MYLFAVHGKTWLLRNLKLKAGARNVQVTGVRFPVKSDLFLKNLKLKVRSKQLRQRVDLWFDNDEFGITSVRYIEVQLCYWIRTKIYFPENVEVTNPNLYKNCLKLQNLQQIYCVNQISKILVCSK